MYSYSARLVKNKQGLTLLFSAPFRYQCSTGEGPVQKMVTFRCHYSCTDSTNIQHPTCRYPIYPNLTSHAAKRASTLVQLFAERMASAYQFPFNPSPPAAWQSASNTWILLSPMLHPLSLVHSLMPIDLCRLFRIESGFASLALAHLHA